MKHKADEAEATYPRNEMSNKTTGSQHTSESVGSISISPQSTGHLVPLKTTLEISAREVMANVYIAAVFPPQKASAALRYARPGSAVLYMPS